MKLYYDNNDDEPEISMSRLIDCVFQLLIFFLVSSMTKVKSTDIAADVPTSTAATKPQPDDKQAVVWREYTGLSSWEGEHCSTNFLLEQLRDVSIVQPDRRIRIDMDKDAPFGRFVEIMDACQFYDLTNIGIRTYDENYNKG